MCNYFTSEREECGPTQTVYSEATAPAVLLEVVADFFHDLLILEITLRLL